MKYNKDDSKLFAIDAELSKEALLTSDERKIVVLTYQNGDTIMCDWQIKMRDRWVSVVYAIDVVVDDVVTLAEVESPESHNSRRLVNQNNTNNGLN